MRSTISPKKIHYDQVIIGQGIAGTFLSWNLLKAGCRVLIIDEDQPFTASKVASGIVNPVTGRRIVRTWRIEELLPFALDAYTALEDELGVKLVSRCNIIDFHPTLQMKEAFDKRIAEERYLQPIGNLNEWRSYFNFHYGAGAINSCLLIDLQTLLKTFRQKLKEQGILMEDRFNWNDCTVFNDHIEYKNITATSIICCDGVAGFTNPYFKNLPYTRMKGEALLVEIPGLPANQIYKQGISIVPWQNDIFWVGSSYEWQFENVMPTAVFRQKAEAQLRQFLQLPFKVIDHLASERPANMERRPFVGFHPAYKTVGLLNGLGTKGCSLAPFFSYQLAQHITEGKTIYPDADVKRFERVLCRTQVNH